MPGSFWVLFFISAATILSECKINKKCQKTVKKLKECISRGFKSTLGCAAGKGRLKKKAVKVCNKLEKKAKKCDFSCEKKGDEPDKKLKEEDSDPQEPEDDSQSGTKSEGCPLLGSDKPCPESMFIFIFG